MDAGVTIHSTLGAVAYNCGALLVDHGWLRVLGAGTDALPGVHASTLKDPTNDREFQGMVVGYDVVGGRFAIHGGGLDDVPLGEVVYWAPDSLDWMPLGFGHQGFLEFVLSEGLADFVRDLRWAAWEPLTETIGLDQGVFIYPPLFTNEGSNGNPTRNPVPLSELIAITEDWARQLKDVPPGGQLTFGVTD